MAEKTFQTKRTELLELYQRNGQNFMATTRGVHSVRSLRFRGVNHGAAGALAYLVADAGQTLNFFSYGQTDSIILSGEINHRATEADTALTNAMKTMASSDLSIEWISMAPRSLKVQYPALAAAPTQTPWVPAATADPVIVAMLLGQRPLIDPFGRVIPVDVGSSATLQHVAYQLAAPLLTCRFEWDNADRTEKMGTCDQFTQGGGASYLNSNGEPSVLNRFRIPEGFLWAREGQPSSSLQVIVKLEEDLVIPIGQVAAPDATFPAITNLWVEIQMRLGGLLLRVPGSN